MACQRGEAEMIWTCMMRRYRGYTVKEVMHRVGVIEEDVGIE